MSRSVAELTGGKAADRRASPRPERPRSSPRTSSTAPRASGSPNVPRTGSSSAASGSTGEVTSRSEPRPGQHVPGPPVDQPGAGVGDLGQPVPVLVEQPHSSSDQQDRPPTTRAVSGSETSAGGRAEDGDRPAVVLDDRRRQEPADPGATGVVRSTGSSAQLAVTEGGAEQPGEPRERVRPCVRPAGRRTPGRRRRRRGVARSPGRPRETRARAPRAPARAAARRPEQPAGPGGAGCADSCVRPRGRRGSPRAAAPGGGAGRAAAATLPPRKTSPTASCGQRGLATTAARAYGHQPQPPAPPRRGRPAARAEDPAVEGRGLADEGTEQPGRAEQADQGALPAGATEQPRQPARARPRPTSQRRAGPRPAVVGGDGERREHEARPGGRHPDEACGCGPFHVPMVADRTAASRFSRIPRVIPAQLDGQPPARAPAAAKSGVSIHHAGRP